MSAPRPPVGTRVRVPVDGEVHGYYPGTRVPTVSARVYLPPDVEIKFDVESHRRYFYTRVPTTDLLPADGAADEYATVLDARVRLGVAYLNATEGVDWPDRVDWTELRQGDVDFCVLGQLNGEFGYTDVEYKFGIDWAIERGFDLGPDECERWDFTPLTAAWRRWRATRHPDPEETP